MGILRYEAIKSYGITILYSYFPNIPGTSDFQPTNVSVQLALDSLIEVDDVASTITMDVYLRLYWTDPRIYMPDLFEYLNPMCTIEGTQLYNCNL